VQARTRSGTRSIATAGACAIAVAMLTAACGASLSSPVATASPASTSSPRQTGSPSAEPPATGATPSAVIPSGQACGDSHGSRPEPQYAFPHVSIPLGSDACQDVGPLADPKIIYLANDGSDIAFSAENYAYQGEIWYGDLQDKSIKVVYQARQTASNRADVRRPQLAAGRLVWLERVHVGPDVNTNVKSWAIKDMDLASGAVKTIISGNAPGHGGTSLVTDFRFDGQRLALAESLAKGWQIQIADLSGHIQSTVPSSQYIFDLGLVSDGLLYSTGIEDPRAGSLGNSYLWHWTSAGGSRQIEPAVYQINSSGALASWVADPIGDQEATGYFQAARLYAALAPFTSGQPISPVDSETGTKGIDGAACGSGTVAWWEEENLSGAWQDVLTLWQPGWSSAVQVDTNGNESYHVSLGGGWVVWGEEFGRENEPLQERIRGVPISVLAAERSHSI
jgi:hypothetical protein